MSYTVMNPQPSGLQPNETAVTLDSGDDVAVSAVCGVQDGSGNIAITASARVINADGTNKLDASGAAVTSGFSHGTNSVEIAAAGSVQAVQKLVLMAVMGESTSPLWADPIHATVLQNASIRTAIASAAHAGPVNTASLL